MGWALQKLYLVGFTTDLRGLILSRQKGVKSGGFIVDVDDQFRLTLEEVSRLHGGDRSAGAPSRDGIVEAVQVPEAAVQADVPAGRPAGRPPASPAARGA